MRFIKFIPLILAFFICGCGKKDTIVNPELSQSLLVSGAFCEQLTEIDTENAEKRYSLNSKDYDELTAAVGTAATCDEFAIIKTSNTESIAADIRDYIELKREVYEAYRPNEVSKLDNAVVEIYNDAVVLIVSGDTQTAMQAYKEYLKN